MIVIVGAAMFWGTKLCLFLAKLLEIVLADINVQDEIMIKIGKNWTSVLKCVVLLMILCEIFLMYNVGAAMFWGLILCFCLFLAELLEIVLTDFNVQVKFMIKIGKNLTSVGSE